MCAEDKRSVSAEQDRQTSLLHYDVPRPAAAVASASASSSSSSSSLSLAPAAAAAAALEPASEPGAPGQIGPPEATTAALSSVGPRDELFASRDRRDVTATSHELNALLTERDGGGGAATADT